MFSVRIPNGWHVIGKTGYRDEAVITYNLDNLKNEKIIHHCFYDYHLLHNHIFN
jgi:hypothetical protein